jgi:hypothetical protein
VKTVFNRGDLLRKVAATGVSGSDGSDQWSGDSAGLGVRGADAVVVAVEVEARKADPVEGPAVGVGDPPVDRARVGEELQERLDGLAGLGGLGRGGAA